MRGDHSSAVHRAEIEFLFNSGEKSFFMCEGNSCVVAQNYTEWMSKYVRRGAVHRAGKTHKNPSSSRNV